MGFVFTTANPMQKQFAVLPRDLQDRFYISLKVPLQPFNPYYNHKCAKPRQAIFFLNFCNLFILVV